ncbi:hypothetical protein ABVT39_024366 [Epinephelus coioides]
MEYTLEKDEKLPSIAKGIPNNAKYTSKNIQNEIIQTLTYMVLGEVRKKYENADAAGFCLKSDGTRDRCNVENLSVMIRFASNSMPEEHLIGLLDLDRLDAEYITSVILTCLSDAGYSADNILSQCYDGASVMSGHHYVNKKYDAPNLRRLLQICWTSHYEVTRCIIENQDQILNILSETTEDDGAAVDLRTEASGLHCQIKRQHFFETGKFLVQVLGVLKPANAILQSVCGYVQCF